MATPDTNRLSNDSPPGFLTPVLLSQVPFFPQEQYQCGPAALATVLQDSGILVSPEDLVAEVYLPNRQGSLQLEMLAAPRRQERISYLLDPTLDALINEVKAGRPVVVFQNLGLSWLPQWHYAVVIGYDLSSGMLILHSGTQKNYHLPLHTFERTWRRAGSWAFVVLRPGELPENADRLRYLEAVLALEPVASLPNVATAYEAGAARWADSPLFLTALGNLYYTQDNYPAAQISYQRLVDAHPDFAEGYNNLAVVLLRQGQHEAALMHIEQALALGGARIEAYRQTRTDILAAASQR